MTGREHWFFIIGCQRSGTTLMRLVLECHSRLECWDEAIAYPVIAGKRPSPPPDGRLIGLKVPCLTEQLSDAYVWDARLLPKTPNVYDGHRIVFMVRDVRDTVASMLNLRLSGRPWLETHLLPTLRAKLHRDSAFRKRYDTLVAQLNRARYPRLARAALYWRYKVDALQDYLQREFPTLLIRYEDVALHPCTELLRVCGFLQIPWEASLLRHHSLPHTQLNAGGLATGNTDPHRAIDDRSLHRWRNVFTPDQLAEIMTFAGPMQTLIYGCDRHGDRRVAPDDRQA